MSLAPRPPAVDPLVALADQCVQCGLCLPACPTYSRDQVEAESARGRIALMRAWALKTIDPTPLGDLHLDQCLGCRRCEAVCPAGVKYDALLVLARSRQRKRRGWNSSFGSFRGVLQRAAEMLATHPRLLRGLLHLYRRSYHWLPHPWRLLPRPPVRDETGLRHVIGAPRQTVALFVGCIAGPYEKAARAALRRLCGLLRIDVVIPPAQVCCGSLHAHAGDCLRADRLAARNRMAFFAPTATSGPPNLVLTLASGCHDTVARTLQDAAETVDALVFLNGHADQLSFRRQPERIALHLPCTQRHAGNSVPALRRLLARVPGLEVIELDAGHGCCGAAGTQMITDPARAGDFRRPLLAQLAASGATRLLSANIGCRLHLARAAGVPVLHPVEFLAEVADDTPERPSAAGGP